MWSLLVLWLIECTARNIDGAKWRLAFNIHASDGHDFGYGSKAWTDKNDIGAYATAFAADYKSYDATIEPANFIAIVRHQNGACEAARVWKFTKAGKTLHSYLDVHQTSRLRATKDHHIYSYIGHGMKYKGKDPIFAVDGGLVFNWWYGDNGARIGNSKAYSGSGLPAVDQSVYLDNYQGLGNDFGGVSKSGGGSSHWRHDVGVHQSDCGGNNCLIQGKDHGTALSDRTLYGQYAIYISDRATTFPCESVNLNIYMFDLDTTDFDRIDRHDLKGFLTYDEVVFDMADGDKDGFLSLKEFTKAREENRYRETISNAGVWMDFQRIDKDGDGLLNYDDLAFAMADTSKDGKLSLVEFSRARADSGMSETNKL